MTALATRAATGMAHSMAVILPRYAPLLLLALAWEAATRGGLVPEIGRAHV